MTLPQFPRMIEISHTHYMKFLADLRSLVEQLEGMDKEDVKIAEAIDWYRAKLYALEILCQQRSEVHQQLYEILKVLQSEYKLVRRKISHDRKHLSIPLPADQ